METYFAPAPKTEPRKFENQLADISQSQIMDTLLKTSAGILVVLNEDRQIVAMNHSFLENLEMDNIQEVLGLRLGESLGCTHAYEQPAGCGTTEHCVSCGAAIAMMSAIQDKREDERICALVSDRDGSVSDICLQVRAKPINVDGKQWVLFYAQDVTREQFWLNMDRVFFHDVNNTLTALYGNVQLLEMGQPPSKEITIIRKTVERLVNEIAIQKNFSHHRDVTYTPAKAAVELDQVKKELDAIISGHKASTQKTIIATWPTHEVILETDPLLLSRILGNMVINALEATPKGGTIKITVEAVADGQVSWQVWNGAVIPLPIQKRIFQRYFSSKSGDGRGLGTYSMKLFGETYLKGKISFHSSEKQGTQFNFTLPISDL